MASNADRPASGDSAIRATHLAGPPNSATAKPMRHRLSLSGTSPRRISFERRVRLWLAALAIPALALSGVLVFEHTQSLAFTIAVIVAVALLWAIVASFLFEQLTRPLQTLSNVVAALREDDFSFRARGARRGDSLGDLALEVNALASTLQHQRSAALDALSLVELVMTSMQSPVLAFDSASRLNLLNPAAQRAFRLSPQRALGRTAQDLHLTSLLGLADQGLYQPEGNPARATGSVDVAVGMRWSVRRTTFRLHGIPHTLFVLADVAAALREEERIAWQRLIRVLGHEINNSLTPIKSIAGSLRSRLPSSALESAPEKRVVASLDLRVSNNADPHDSPRDFDRGLAVIEDRADSLNRFLQAYQKLSGLPAPVLAPTSLQSLLAKLIELEIRLPVTLTRGPDTSLLADSDQLQQLFINLIRNAADAALISALASAGRSPHVEITWSVTAKHAVIRILDNGVGLASTANLFVPFYTTKPGGTGVGLVLAQQIATAHRGTVNLRNRPDTPGCEAEVRLPLLG